MSSQAFIELGARLDEARLLTNQDPARAGDTSKPKLTNAINRGALVLTCSHLEGYLEDVAVEALDFLVFEKTPVEQLPLLLRALHTDKHLRDLEPMRDRNARAGKIERLFRDEGPLWQQGMKLKARMLQSEVVTEQMSNPGSKEIEQFLELIGVPHLFGTLESQGLTHLKQHTNELVGKRNAIAHGEVSATATSADVDRYIRTVEDLAKEIDSLVALAVQRICQRSSTPWAI